MSNLSHYICSGYLTKDCVKKDVGQSGLVEFTTAVNVGFSDKAQTLFVKCTLWGKRGDSLLPYLVKGKGVILAGTLTMNNWTSQQDGSVHNDLCLNVSELSFLPSTAISDDKGNETTAEEEPVF